MFLFVTVLVALAAIVGGVGYLLHLKISRDVKKALDDAFNSATKDL